MTEGAGLHPRAGAVPEGTIPGGASTPSNVAGWSQPATSSPSDRLRWIADYLDLADKAIALVACVQGVEYPSDLHQRAQRDLRRWARWLDASPVAADQFAAARVGPVAVTPGGGADRHP